MLRTNELACLKAGRDTGVAPVTFGFAVLIAALLIAFAWPSFALAQADAGLLTELRGGVTYQAADVAEMPAQSLMKLRVGDRLRIPAGASIKLVYFKSALTESWRGPAAFVVGAERAEQTQGEFTSTPLPNAARVPVELHRVAGLNRIGAVVVRSIKPPEVDIAQARERYKEWRAGTQADDLLPDFYLYAVLKQYDLKSDMAALAADMLKRAPGSIEAQKLARESAATPAK